MLTGRMTILLLLALTLVGCARPIDPGLHRYAYAEIIMGVRAEVTLFATDEHHAVAAARAAFDRMRALDDTLTDYRPTSELMQLESRSEGTPRLASHDLIAVLTDAGRISEATGGAFDVTVGPLTRLWRQARREGEPPSNAAIAEAASRVGWQRIVISIPDRTIAMPSGTQLDLGAIGKGFAVDEAVRTLRAFGVEQCLINLGGDLAAGAPPPGRDAWVIEIQSGLVDAPTLTVPLVNMAMATSGDAEQFLDLGAARYSHIVDPRTGEALTRRIAVTVIAPRASTADALASAISVLGAENGLAILEQFDGTAARVVDVEEDVVRITISPGFPDAR